MKKFLTGWLSLLLVCCGPATYAKMQYSGDKTADECQCRGWTHAKDDNCDTLSTQETCENSFIHADRPDSRCNVAIRCSWSKEQSRCGRGGLFHC